MMMLGFGGAAKLLENEFITVFKGKLESSCVIQKNEET